MAYWLVEMVLAFTLPGFWTVELARDVLRLLLEAFITGLGAVIAIVWLGRLVRQHERRLAWRTQMEGDRLAATKGLIDAAHALNRAMLRLTWDHKNGCLPQKQLEAVRLALSRLDCATTHARVHFGDKGVAAVKAMGDVFLFSAKAAHEAKSFDELQTALKPAAEVFHIGLGHVMLMVQDAYRQPLDAA